MYSEVPLQIVISVPCSPPASPECWVLRFRVQFYLCTQYFNNTMGEPHETSSSPTRCYTMSNPFTSSPSE